MTYSEAYFTARESWRDWRIEVEELVSLAGVFPGARILEIGCGGGGLLERLCRRGVRAFGVDTLETALYLARSRDGSGGAVRAEPAGLNGSPALVRIGEDGTLPFAAGSFDAVVAQHVLEHLADVPQALCEWRRVLVTGGRLAIATPNARYPDPGHFADLHHAHVFTPDELCAAVEHAGFLPAHCSTVFPFLSRLRLLRAAGLVAYRLFQSAPYFSARGRTILVAGRKP